ncbi:MAG TPA: hypothetical protein VKB19_19865 [Pedobacter sp.]|nr:hypothetical protein [Pedobacter sp.]
MKAGVKDLFRLRRLIVLQVDSGRVGADMISDYELILSGEQMQVSGKQEGLKNIAHFSKQHKPGPVVLCLSGKIVLSKTAPSGGLSGTQVFAQTLPNAKIDDFYIQSSFEAENSQISVIRKETVDLWVDELKVNGFNVVALLLGNPVGFKDNAIRLMLGAGVIKADHAGLKESLEQEVAKSRLKGISMVFVAALFILLLLNFLLFSHYTDRTNQLQRENNITGTQVEKFQEMEQELQQKASLIRNAGWTGGHAYAWITDRLMASKPAAILVSGFSINPLKETSTLAEPEVYEAGQIKISGSSEDAAVLNNWLHQIRSMGWVKNCEMNVYGQNRDTGKGDFVIQIHLNDYQKVDQDES